MLTPGHTPDPKSKLTISSFLTLQHVLDCLICTRNTMSIVLLLLMMKDGIVERWLIYIRLWKGDRAWVTSYSFCFFFHMILYFLL